jgi:hypothetical protein
MDDRTINTFAISALVLAAIGCSAALGAPIEVVCTKVSSKTTFCSTNNDGDQRSWICTKQRGGTWKCVEAKTARTGGPPIDPGLKDTVTDAATRAGKK